MVSVTGVRAPSTRRALRVNHLLRPGDLGVEAAAPQSAEPVGPLEALIGRYLTVAKAAGQTLAPGDVSEGPQVEHRGRRLFSVGVPLQRALGGLLEPELQIDVYGTVKGAAGATSSEQIVTGASLVAVIRNEGSLEAPLTLILALPGGGAADEHLDGIFVKLVGAGDLFIVVRG